MVCVAKKTSPSLVKINRNPFRAYGNDANKIMNFFFFSIKLWINKNNNKKQKYATSRRGCNWLDSSLAYAISDTIVWGQTTTTRRQIISKTNGRRRAEIGPFFLLSGRPKTNKTIFIYINQRRRKNRLEHIAYPIFPRGHYVQYSSPTPFFLDIKAKLNCYISTSIQMCIYTFLYIFLDTTELTVCIPPPSCPANPPPLFILAGRCYCSKAKCIRTTIFSFCFVPNDIVSRKP